MFEGEEDRDGSVCVSVAPQKTEKNEVPNLKKCSELNYLGEHDANDSSKSFQEG